MRIILDILTEPYFLFFPLPKFMMNSQNNLELESIITDDESNIISKSNNVALVVSKIDSISGFNLGLVVGITIGVAIGICCIFIIRQKNT